MAANTVVRARIDSRIKDEAADILAATGLTVSDAFRMMLVRSVAERRLPFDPLVPNPETIEAIQAARSYTTSGDTIASIAAKERTAACQSRGLPSSMEDGRCSRSPLGLSGRQAQRDRPALM